MRIVVLSDTHNQHRKVQVPDGDIVIHAGDACINGTPEELKDFLRWFAMLPHRHRILVGGNHDSALTDPGWREAALPGWPTWTSQRGGFLYLEDETAHVYVGERLLRIHGAPWRPRPDDWTPGEPMRPGKRSSAFGVRESLIGQFWDTIPEGLDILVTHVPAYGMLDEIEETPISAALRIGCTALASKLARMRHPPKAHIFGHVHDPGGCSAITPTGMHVYNVAICDANYAPTRQPQVIDL